MLAKILVFWTLSSVAFAFPVSAQDIQPTTKRIKWHTSALEGFIEAVKSDKLFVIVFLSNPAYRPNENGSVSSRVWPELDELVVHELADDAVFALVWFDHRTNHIRDEHARVIFQRLRLDSLPTISVVWPRTDILEEIHRIEGGFQAALIASDLKRCIQHHVAEQAKSAKIEASKIPSNGVAIPLEVNPYEPSLK